MSRPEERERPRLERAIEAMLAFHRGELGRDELFAANADLRDLLEGMLAEEAENPEEDAPRRIGDYRLVRELGRGGMGVVFEAIQGSLGRTVALKLLHAECGLQPATVLRFRHEANVLGRLEHPGIVRVFDVGTSDGVPWIAMECIDGESLDQRLARVRAQGGHRGDSLRAAVETCAQVAEALQHAHDAGVVHRDVKPSNVLLRAGGAAVLTDFGLARDEDAPTLTVAGAVPGTLHYLAPERLREGARGADTRSDVFALGATLYEAITLARPFEAASTEQVIHRILTSDPADPRRVQHDLPVDLAAIAMKALEKDPRQRYQSAAEVGDELRAFLEFRPVRARPVSRLGRVARWCRREPAKATLVLLLLLSLVGASVAGGTLLARQKAIHAGEESLRAQQVESLLARGFHWITTRNRDADWRRDFEEALRLDPRRYEAHFGIAWGYREANAIAQGLEYLAALPAPVREDRALQRLRAVLLRGEQPEAAKAIEERLGAPRAPFEQLIAAVALHARGRAAKRDDVAREALAWIARAERLWPQPSLVHLCLWAFVARDVGDEASMRDCAGALEQHFPEVPSACATVCVLLGKFDRPRALAAAERAVQFDPSVATWRFNLAVQLYESGAKDAAFEQLERALALDPDHAAALVQRGVIWTERKDLERAHADLERAVALAPESGFAWYNAGYVRFQRGDRENALLAMRKAVELLPRDPTPHQSLVNLLGYLNRTDEAAAEQERWESLSGK